MSCLVGVLCSQSALVEHQTDVLFNVSGILLNQAHLIHIMYFGHTGRHINYIASSARQNVTSIRTMPLLWSGVILVIHTSQVFEVIHVLSVLEVIHTL